MTKTFLDKIYDGSVSMETEELYDTWAVSYDSEIEENGYATPRRCAEALAGLANDPAAPVLDLGCGTGLSGVALRAAGFTRIDGMDLSQGMLDKARARAGVYRDLIQVTANDPLPFDPGAYTHVLAAGVISPDHAPADTMDAVLERLPPGGTLVFSLNDHALSFPDFADGPARIEAAGLARISFNERGPHLPGIGLEAVVIGLTRT